jgi:histone H3/H4
MYLKGAQPINPGDTLGKRTFSMYDVEQFIREAGAEKVNERAVICLEKELKETADHLVELAATYANHAGRTRTIKRSDVVLARNAKMRRLIIARKGVKRARTGRVLLRPNVIGAHGRAVRINSLNLESK